MSTWNPQANDIFLWALALSAARERQEYLDGACQDDAALLGSHAYSQEGNPRRRASGITAGSNRRPSSLRLLRFSVAHEPVTESVTEFLLSDGKSVKFGKRKCWNPRDLRFVGGIPKLDVEVR